MGPNAPWNNSNLKTFIRIHHLSHQSIMYENKRFNYKMCEQTIGIGGRREDLSGRWRGSHGRNPEERVNQENRLCDEIYSKHTGTVFFAL